MNGKSVHVCTGDVVKDATCLFSAPPPILQRCAAGQGSAMDTTTSLKMTSVAVQSLFTFVEEDNLAAVKAHLDKFRDVDSRSDVGPELMIRPKTVCLYSVRKQFKMHV